jgi:hypothetical protein
MLCSSCGERQRNMGLLQARGSGGVSSMLPRRFLGVSQSMVRSLQAEDDSGKEKPSSVQTVGDLHGTFRSIGPVT